MINSKEDFERESHYRIADRCCGNCKHGLGDFEGEATCEHPKRNDFGHCGDPGDRKVMTDNVWQCNVCDWWEKREGEAAE